MKIGFPGLAMLLIVVGGLLVGVYQLGAQRGADPTESASTALPTASGSGAAVQPVANNLPPNHPPTVTPVGRPGEQPFTHFRVGNRNVKSIFSDGNIVWIGTSGGVIRYDIKADQYKLFDNKTQGLLSNGIFHVSRIGDRVMVGTYGGGLSVYDLNKETWRNYNIPDGLADQFVYDVHLAKNGDIWVATWSGANRIKGGQLDDPTQWESHTVESTGGGLPNPWVYALDEAPDGSMWFATEYGLAHYKDGNWRNWQHREGLGAPFEVVKDAIQFTSDPGKASSHHAQQKAEQGLQDINVAYNPNYIISLVVDNQGMVWCGTWGGGLARFDGTSWRNYTTQDGLPANHIFMLYKDPDGHVWAGTSRGLARLNDDGKGFSVLTMADGLFADNVFSMSNAPDGSVWVGSFGGVARLAHM